MNVEMLKEKFLENIDTWLEERIDEVLKDNPTLVVPSVYLKRGCHNIVGRYRGKIEESIDKASLFFADENGEIDMNTLFADVMSIFENMEEMSFDMGMMKGTIGKGKITLTMPENILTNIVFGNKKTLAFGEEDLRELKTLMVE